VKRLYKAIDLERVNYVSERTFGSPVKVIFVKADFNVGRLDLLVKALERLPHHQFILSIIGPEKRFERTIRKLCSNATNVAVQYLGPQPQAVVYQYLYGCDLFCVPSATEALGVANIEALAAGIPVISTRVGGIPEVLDQGNNGWLVEPGDPAALADAIRECIADSGRRRQQSENGLRYIRRFSKEMMFASFIEIITDVVEECN
jgi:glycosyltransferase involved in cell wall biosynthesis